ncbi:hypothetical protein V6N13_106236 [Hibiscus sabdariffa]
MELFEKRGARKTRMQAFARLSAVYGVTYILNRPDLSRAELRMTLHFSRGVLIEGLFLELQVEFEVMGKPLALPLKAKHKLFDGPSFLENICSGFSKQASGASP